MKKVINYKSWFPVSEKEIISICFYYSWCCINFTWIFKLLFFALLVLYSKVTQQNFGRLYFFGGRWTLLSQNLTADLLWTCRRDYTLRKEDKSITFTTLQNHIQVWFVLFWKKCEHIKKSIPNWFWFLKPKRWTIKLNTTEKKNSGSCCMKVNLKVKKETNCVLWGVYNFLSHRSFAALFFMGFYWVFFHFLLHSKLKLRRERQEGCLWYLNKILIKENRY